MNHRIKWGKIQWKYRLMALLSGIAVVVILFSFISIYQVFMETMQKTMLDTTTNAFIQAEINIGRKLETTKQILNKLLYKDFIYDYETNNYRDEVSRATGTVEIIKEFDSILSLNHDLFGIGILCTDGRVAASTKRNRTLGGELMSKDKIHSLLEKSDEVYPEYIWTGNFNKYLDSHNSISILSQEEVIVGIRSFGDYRVKGEERGYFIVAIKESAIEECYSQILYSENEVMLLSDGTIISGTNKAALGSTLPYEVRDALSGQVQQSVWKDAEDNGAYQIIQYQTKLEDWILVNQIPKKIYENQTERLKKISFIIGIATIAVMCLFFTVWILKYANPIQRLMIGMHRVAEGDYLLLDDKSTGVKELDALNSQFNYMTQKLKDSIHQLKENEVALRTEELRTLQFQINPHFLLNSINSIRWMAMMTNNVKVGDALVILNKIIYPILKTPSFWGTVKDEIDFADNYIQMLKLRFSSSLSYEIDCDSRLWSYKFPRFILQPIIENCFTHGMEQGETLFVETTITERSGYFYIKIHNSGKEVEKNVLDALNFELHNKKSNEETTGRDSIGLKNVRKRLDLLFENKSRMRMESNAEDGTTVFIEFPILNKE